MDKEEILHFILFRLTPSIFSNCFTTPFSMGNIKSGMLLLIQLILKNRRTRIFAEHAQPTLFYFGLNAGSDNPCGGISGFNQYLAQGFCIAAVYKITHAYFIIGCFKNNINVFGI